MELRLTTYGPSHPLTLEVESLLRKAGETPAGVRPAK
jgi:hypothetical protein